MPQAYREHTLTLVFNEQGVLGNEIKIIESVFKKFEKIACKPGYKKDFTVEELDMIQSLAKANSSKNAIGD